jgi:chaperonin GroEL (HSP60 family)
MGDIGVLTGATPVFKDLGIELESIKLSDLGRAKKVKITSDDTIIVGGAGKKADIEGGLSRSAKRSRPPTATMIARNFRSGWPSWLAASLRSTAVRRRRPR